MIPIVMGILCSSDAKGEDNAPSLLEITKQFDLAYERLNEPLTRLNASYLVALQRLLQQESEAGNLDNALAVRTEIELFGNGDDETLANFNSRPSQVGALEKLRATYRTERIRMRNESKVAREQLRSAYDEKLAALEQEMTRTTDLGRALNIRRARESLTSDRRFLADEDISPSPGLPFKGSLHFVGKGTVEIRHNSARLSYRNLAGERDKYVIGIIRDIELKDGDILLVKMKSNVVFRSFIMAIESDDAKISLPLIVSDYHDLGTDEKKWSGNKFDVKEVQAIEARPESGPADDDMRLAWQQRQINAQTKTASEWMRCGPGDSWHHYAIIIHPGLLARNTAGDTP